MSNYDTGSRAYMQSIFNGQTPVKRQTVLPGQSKYYYYKPGQSDDIAVSDMKTVDVPTADTPNPFLNKTENEDIGYSKNALSQMRNNFSTAYNIYKKGGLYALGNEYAEPSVKQALQAKDEITPLNIPDVNKHQYISCVGAIGGPLATAETLIGGIYKEAQDTREKLADAQKRQAYGGIYGVLADAVKDLKNDVIGSALGYAAGRQGIPGLCDFLLSYPINVKW